MYAYNIHVDPLNYSSFQPVLHDWCNKGIGFVLSCLCDDAYKRTLAASKKRIAHVAAAGFLSPYLSGPLPYVRRL